MILHAGVLALLLGTCAVAVLLLLAVGHALAILRHWDLRRGSALQLQLERRTYLVSLLLAYALAFELISLFLFVHTADDLAPMFTGAMCATGTLSVNGYGYPALLLGLSNFVLGGVWLVLNHADGLGDDYPLIRSKYALLLLFAPLVLVEGWLRLRFFLGLQPEMIASCCGSSFSPRGKTIGARLAALPTAPVAWALYGTVGMAIGMGGWTVRRRRGAAPIALGIASAVALVVGLIGLIAYVSPYVYELPTHVCPFCMFQGAYGWVGYPLYGSLLMASVCGMGAGALTFFRRAESLSEALPALQCRLAGWAIALFVTFGGGVAWSVWSSHLVRRPP